MKRQENVLVHDICGSVRDKCGFTFTTESVTLLGFRCLRPPSSHFQVMYQSECFFFLYVHFNKLILYPSSPPVSILIACSAGMLKVTQGSADLFAFMRRSVCRERGLFDVQECQLGSREHLTCRCQLGPKPSLRTHAHTHTHTHTHVNTHDLPRGLQLFAV